MLASGLGFRPTELGVRLPELAELAGRLPCGLAGSPILRDVNFPCKIFCDNF